MSGRSVTQPTHPLHEVARTAEDLSKAVQRGFSAVWRSARVDLYEPGAEEVLTGLLARQVRFFAIMADDPHFWQPDFAGIGLRAMTEALINLQYIAAGGNELAQRFREYAIGHVKLQKLHIEKLVDAGALPSDWESRVDALQQQIDLERWEETIQIDLGRWTDADIREIATSVGLKAEYDLFYAPGSAHMHGEWSSLIETVLTPCRDPLHRFHRVPLELRLVPQNPRFLVSALDLLDQTFRSWRVATGGDLPDYQAEANAFRAALQRFLDYLAALTKQRAEDSE
jgi:hypothetical protein